MGAKYNSGLKYNTGLIYVDQTVRIRYYRAQTNSEQGTEASIDLMRHVQFRIKHNNGTLFLMQASRMLARRGRHTLPVYRVDVQDEGYQKMSVIVRHMNGTLFQVWELRAHAHVSNRRLLD